MAKVFATVMGSRIRLGNHGEAVLVTVMEPDPASGEARPRVIEEAVTVPEDVAADIEWEMAGCPVDEDGNRDMAGKPSREPHARFRIERDGAPTVKTAQRGRQRSAVSVEADITPGAGEKE